MLGLADSDVVTLPKLREGDSEGDVPSLYEAGPVLEAVSVPNSDDVTLPKVLDPVPEAVTLPKLGEGDSEGDVPSL